MSTAYNELLRHKYLAVRYARGDVIVDAAKGSLRKVIQWTEKEIKNYNGLSDHDRALFDLEKCLRGLSYQWDGGWLSTGGSGSTSRAVAFSDTAYVLHTDLCEQWMGGYRRERLATHAVPEEAYEFHQTILGLVEAGTPFDWIVSFSQEQTWTPAA